jgi:uncharacterized protein (TIGR02996 family)
MTATTADELGLIAAVCADPDDDVVRLAYADYLEENAGAVPCPAHCHRGRVCTSDIYEGTEWEDCPTCNGSGTAPDGRADRAELIRVQCELAKLDETWQARWNAGTLGDDHPVKRRADRGYGLSMEAMDALTAFDTRRLALRRREGALFSAVCDQFPRYSSSQVRLESQASGEWPIEMVVRRGFVERLALSWEAFAGGECGRCGGLGRSGQDRCAKCGKSIRHTNHWCCGVNYNCPDCKSDDQYRASTGRTPGIHRDLIWWPDAKDECPGCKGKKGRINPTGGHVEFSGPYPRWEDCYQCSGQGTVPRPVPPTAQPVTHVTITGEFPVDQGFVLATTMASAGRQTWFNPRWPTVTFTLPA